MHAASRLHFDFRIEFEGVFKSWAIPKGPSLNPQDQRLAVFVEDHPLDYGSFEGIIPKGNYGAGTVMVWDEGTYIERGSEGREDSEKAMRKGFDNGHMTFILSGEKLKGEFALIQLKKNTSEKAWLLVKKRDEHSTYKKSEIPNNLSIKTGRNIEEIAAQAEDKGHVWLPKQEKQKKTAIMSAPAKKALPTAPKKSVPVKQDPLPRKNKPMLATQSRKSLPEGPWFYEEDHQGLRALAEVEKGRVSLYSRSGLPFEKKFPEIVDELKELSEPTVLDGEIITAKSKSYYSVFDVLYWRGQDLRKESLQYRKQILRELPKGKNFGVAPPAGKKSSRVIAKRLDSLCRAGTSSDWLIMNKPIDLPAPSVLRSKRIEPTARKILEKKEVRQSPQHFDREEARLTNLDKIFWPEDGFTKGDLIDYYRSISKYILPFLKDRPESLNRLPNGIAAPGFYQKDMTGHIPRWLKTERIFSESADKSIDYVLCQDERSLLYIVNLGCIEINPWFSRIGNLNHPDFMVIDLDPDGNNFDHVIEIAHEFRQLFESVGMKSFCKTSGATGIHIGVPMGAKYDFDQVREFAEMACRIVVKKFPATTSVDRSPQRRRKKIYLDFLQNRRGQTLAAPFCVRPHKGAPVSMPLPWEELKKGLKPEQFNIQNAMRLIPKNKLIWDGVLGIGADLRKCRALLSKKT